MTAVESFDKWFGGLAKDQKREVVLHVVKMHAIPLNEGIYGGPVGVIKGIFAGPSGQTGEKKCPCCGK